MDAFLPETIVAQLLTFLDRLEAANIAYDLKHIRDSLMVCATVAPGYWEIEFFADGTVEVEHFRRQAGVEAITPAWLDQFLSDYGG